MKLNEVLGFLKIMLRDKRAFSEIFKDIVIGLLLLVLLVAGSVLLRNNGFSFLDKIKNAVIGG